MRDNILQIVKTYSSVLLSLFIWSYLEGFIATCMALFIGYLLAGMPEHIPWLKLMPTLLIAFPVYGNRTHSIRTFGGAVRQKKWIRCVLNAFILSVLHGFHGTFLKVLFDFLSYLQCIKFCPCLIAQ